MNRMIDESGLVLVRLRVSLMGFAARVKDCFEWHLTSCFVVPNHPCRASLFFLNIRSEELNDRFVEGLALSIALWVEWSRSDLLNV